MYDIFLIFCNCESTKTDGRILLADLEKAHEILFMNVFNTKTVVIIS